MSNCEIQVIGYKGKTSGHAFNEKDLWRVCIKNTDNGKCIAFNLDKDLTQQDANLRAIDYSNVMGFPVVQYTEKVTYTTTLHRLSE